MDYIYFRSMFFLDRFYKKFIFQSPSFQIINFRLYSNCLLVKTPNNQYAPLSNN